MGSFVIPVPLAEGEPLPETPEPQPNPAQYPEVDNYPFVSCSFALGFGQGRVDDPVTGKIIRTKNWHVQQALGNSSSSGRLDNKQRLSGFLSDNPKCQWIWHIDYIMIEFDDSSFSSNAWLAPRVWERPDEWTDMYIREANGQPLGHTSDRGQGWALNWAMSASNRQHIIDRQIDQWTDFDSANGHLNNGIPASWMEDTMPIMDFRYTRGPDGGYGQIQAVINATEVDIDRVDAISAAGTGNVDVEGYETLQSNVSLRCLNSARTQGDWANIVSYKHMDSNTTRLRLANTLEDISLTNAWYCILPFGKFWGRSQRGNLTQTQYRSGFHAFGDTVINTVKSRYGLDIGKYVNMGARNFRVMKDGEFRGVNNLSPGNNSPHIDEGVWHGIHYERVAVSTGGLFAVNNWDTVEVNGIPPGGAYYLKRQDAVGSQSAGNNYLMYDLLRGIEINRAMLLPDDDNLSIGLSVVWPNIQIRAKSNTGTSFRQPGDGAIAIYELMTRLDAAAARFWTLFGWCYENVAPQIELGKPHDMPVLIDEEVINAGERLSTPGFGDFDNNAYPGNYGVNDYAGFLTLRTPDFGNAGFFQEFENCLIIINIRDDSDARVNGTPWIPHWLAGGQTLDASKDTATLPDPGAGKKWKRFDRVNYVNDNPNSPVFQGKSPTDFDDCYILSDTTWNNPSLGPQPGGGYAAGDTISVGSMEAIILMRVNT